MKYEWKLPSESEDDTKKIVLDTKKLNKIQFSPYLTTENFISIRDATYVVIPLNLSLEEKKGKIYLVSALPNKERLRGEITAEQLKDSLIESIEEDIPLVKTTVISALVTKIKTVVTNLLLSKHGIIKSGTTTDNFTAFVVKGGEILNTSRSLQFFSNSEQICCRLMKTHGVVFTQESSVSAKKVKFILFNQKNEFLCCYSGSVRSENSNTIVIPLEASENIQDSNVVKQCSDILEKYGNKLSLYWLDKNQSQEEGDIFWR